MTIRYFYCIVLLLSCLAGIAQPNCELYKRKGDSLCYHACLEAANDSDFPQGSAASQKQFDRALAICPSFEYAIYEKAVPYLKRGDFVTWQQAINKVVALKPKEYLGIRAWCSFKFLKDYAGAIKDIETLTALSTYDIGNSGDGDYHLNVLLALCYKATGEKGKAITIIEKQLAIKDYVPLPYDYLHLGVLKLEAGDYEGAINSFKKEIEINDYLAETYYYLALAYKKSNNKTGYNAGLVKAKEFYLAGKKLSDPYVDPMDRVYLMDIMNEIKKGF